MKCCICGKTVKGHGHNPYPLFKGNSAKCCDACNVKVIMERIRLSMKGN